MSCLLVYSLKSKIIRLYYQNRHFVHNSKTQWRTECFLKMLVIIFIKLESQKM